MEAGNVCEANTVYWEIEAWFVATMFSYKSVRSVRLPKIEEQLNLPSIPHDNFAAV